MSRFISFIKHADLSIVFVLLSGVFAQSKDVRILAINDFHGHISEGQKIGDRPVGGAAVLASYLKSEIAGNEDQTFIVEAGDLMGASEPASSLLQDEPTVMFFNFLGNGNRPLSDRLDPFNNLVGCLGNHEFDRGTDELLRLINGGNYPKGPFSRKSLERRAISVYLRQRAERGNGDTAGVSVCREKIKKFFGKSRVHWGNT